MDAIILAGGFGTRLREVVSDLPKAMAPIAGRPFLEILLDTLESKGFTRVVFSLGFMAAKIVDHFGKRYGKMRLEYVIEEKPLGTGGGVRLAMQECFEDHVYVFNGDTYLDLEVSSVEHLWKKNRRPIIVARNVDDTSRYGRLDIDSGQVKRFSEKGTGGAGPINAGCYVFNQHQLDRFNSGLAFSLESDYLVEEVKTSDFDVFFSSGLFIDIGIPSDYLRAQTELIVL